MGNIFVFGIFIGLFLILIMHFMDVKERITKLEVKFQLLKEK